MPCITGYGGTPKRDFSSSLACLPTASRAPRPSCSPAPRTMGSAAFARPAEPAAAAPRQDAPARVTARVDEHQEQPPAGPLKDWDLLGLPADCAPGRGPELLTDAQVNARSRLRPHPGGICRLRVSGSMAVTVDQERCSWWWSGCVDGWRLPRGSTSRLGCCHRAVHPQMAH